MSQPNQLPYMIDKQLPYPYQQSHYYLQQEIPNHNHYQPLPFQYINSPIQQQPLAPMQQQLMPTLHQQTMLGQSLPSNYLQIQGQFPQLPQNDQMQSSSWYSNAYYQAQSAQVEQDRLRVESEKQRIQLQQQQQKQQEQQEQEQQLQQLQQYEEPQQLENEQDNQQNDQEEEGEIKRDERKKNKKKRKLRRLIEEYYELFPNKQASVVLLEYSQKQKIDYKIHCEQIENGQGFCAHVILKGIQYSQRGAKSKKEAKESAAMEALYERCESDDELRYFLEQSIDKERMQQKKLQESGYRHGRKESKKPRDEDEVELVVDDDDEVYEQYDPQTNYRDKVTIFAQSELKQGVCTIHIPLLYYIIIYRIGVNFELNGEANSWESICKIGKLITRGKGTTKKEAKNAAAFEMFLNLNKNSIKTLRKAIKKGKVDEKIKETSQKIQG